MNKEKVIGMSKALRTKEAGLTWRVFQCLPIFKSAAASEGGQRCWRGKVLKWEGPAELE